MAKGFSQKRSGQNQDLIYKEEVLKFKVALSGSIQIGYYAKRSGVKLGKNSRTNSIQVVSLSDFTYQDAEDKRLKVRVSRESYDSNKYNVTFSVSSTVKEGFTKNVLLKSSSKDGPQEFITVKYDPKDLTFSTAYG
jgi:hypothetical protein